ncbi:chondroitin sulfate proteoglycan 4 [Vespula maculifrons]|uniref:Chondroitin sulfate proteoglycan 4 n=1 Tax=Vespula maculifrons TaxID=7453 RepID=A0ABD2BI71_VESMC
MLLLFLDSYSNSGDSNGSSTNSNSSSDGSSSSSSSSSNSSSSGFLVTTLLPSFTKVHINLGAGESEMASARGLTLNDLSWHEVNLTRREANITLQIDVIHTTRSLLPGRFFELNIHYGVFIGGRGDFNELFLGHTDYLRGCMADIIYNGARVIEYARSRRGQSDATAVTWGCSPEFDATWNTEVSFVEDGAFTAIPRAIPRSGSRKRKKWSRAIQQQPPSSPPLPLTSPPTLSIEAPQQQQHH